MEGKLHDNIVPHSLKFVPVPAATAVDEVAARTGIRVEVVAGEEAATRTDLKKGNLLTLVSHGLFRGQHR